MNIFITGGCGFIGTNLIALMQKRGGYNIKVFDNESLGTFKNIKEFGVEFVHGDILDYECLVEAIKDSDVVIHLAADTRVMDSIENPEKNFYANVVGSMNILKAMRKHGIRTIINASTGGAILGEVPPPVHEAMMPAPESPYGASKLAVEGYLNAFSCSYGMNACSLRFSNVYGPRSWHKGSVVATFMRQILAGKDIDVYGDGEQIRDYVYIDDLCDGILKALNANISGVYQLGTGKPTSINQLISLISNTVSPDYTVKVNYHDARAGEIYKTWCDISKAQKTFGYNPVTILADGIQNTWNWFKQTQGL